MHYYKFNIADYRKDTSHLTTIEHGIYRQLIDWYYLDEKPIPLETQVVSRRLRLGSEMEFSSLQNVLSDFFKQGKTGWVHKRIEVEIKDYHEQAEKNKNNGKLGGRPKKTQSVISGLPDESQNNPNHKPLTNNHKPNKNATIVAVVPDWIPLETWEAFIQMRKRIGKPATDYAMKLLVAKLDRFRSNGQDIKAVLEKSITSSWQDVFEIKGNPADIVKLTVPPSNEPDPALEKIKADAKVTRPPSLAELARMAELRRKA
jgi:uncharacterized protein YdaU (DUF1376 family)